MFMTEPLEGRDWFFLKATTVIINPVGDFYSKHYTSFIGVFTGCYRPFGCLGKKENQNTFRLKRSCHDENNN